MPVTGSLFRSGGFPVLPPTAAEVGSSANHGARGRNGILANWGRETVKRDGSWAPGRGWAKYAALPDVRGPSGVPRSNGGMAVGPAEAAVSSDRNHHAPMARIGRASRTEPWGGGNLGWGWPDGRSWSGGKQNPERRERARAGRDGSLAWQFCALPPVSSRFPCVARGWWWGPPGPARREKGWETASGSAAGVAGRARSPPDDDAGRAGAGACTESSLRWRAPQSRHAACCQRNASGDRVTLRSCLPARRPFARLRREGPASFDAFRSRASWRVNPGGAAPSSMTLWRWCMRAVHHTASSVA